MKLEDGLKLNDPNITAAERPKTPDIVPRSDISRSNSYQRNLTEL